MLWFGDSGASAIPRKEIVINMLPRYFSALALLALAVGLPQTAHAYGDPSGRVAHLSDASGDLSYSPAGERDWHQAIRNRPIISGDRLWSGQRSRAELQTGGAVLRMDEHTGISLLNLDDRIAQIELSQGTLHLRINRVYQGQSYEIATPTLAFVASRPGSYRIEVDADGRSTTIVVFEGNGDAYGERASFPLRAGDTVRFYEPSLRDFEWFGMPGPDAFDRYVQSRDQRLSRSDALRYVNHDMVGYSALDDYGRWQSTGAYGRVWYPTQVASNWAPYRDGHWVWQEPWGWTWVDDAPWGFVSSHYGRWVNVNNRWGWIPGPRSQRAVYAPALVAFIGGSNWNVSISNRGAAIGWFPLGPRDVYVPSYRASRDYFTRVNVTNTTINIVSVTNVYNTYSTGTPDLSRMTYAHRSLAGAVTVVPNSVFINAQPVRQSLVQINAQDSARAEVSHLARVAPSLQSVVGNAPAAQQQRGRNDAFGRQAVAATAPPERQASFAARQQALQAAPGMSVAVPERAGRGRGGERATEAGVRVIGDKPAVNVREVETGRGNAPAAQRAALDRSVPPDRAGGSRERGRGQAAEPARQDAAPQRQQQVQENERQQTTERQGRERQAEQQRQDRVHQDAAPQRQQQEQEQEIERQQTTERQGRERQAEQQRQDGVRQDAARQRQQQAQEIERQQTTERQGRERQAEQQRQDGVRQAEQQRQDTVRQNEQQAQERGRQQQAIDRQARERPVTEQHAMPPQAQQRGQQAGRGQAGQQGDPRDIAQPPEPAVEADPPEQSQRGADQRQDPPPARGNRSDKAVPNQKNPRGRGDKNDGT
jgi:hypothetical protein